MAGKVAAVIGTEHKEGGRTRPPKQPISNDHLHWSFTYRELGWFLPTIKLTSMPMPYSGTELEPLTDSIIRSRDCKPQCSQAQAGTWMSKMAKRILQETGKHMSGQCGPLWLRSSRWLLCMYAGPELLTVPFPGKAWNMDIPVNAPDFKCRQLIQLRKVYLTQWGPN